MVPKNFSPGPPSWVEKSLSHKNLERHRGTFFFAHTLPETNSSPLKIGIPNRKVVFQPAIFRGYGFREIFFFGGVVYLPGLMG